MSAGLYILVDGIPVEETDVRKWGAWFQGHTDERIVQQDRIETPNGTYLLSTVFLAMDYSFGVGPPVLWETMLFSVDGKTEEHMERYTSREQAQQRHLELLREARILLNAVPVG